MNLDTIEIGVEEYKRYVACECVVKMLNSFVGNEQDYLSTADLKKILSVVNMKEGD